MNEQINPLALPADLQKERQKVVGASEIACLFGPEINPPGRPTAWELGLIKTGQLPPPDLSNDEFVQGGIYKEPAVANWTADRMGWTLVHHGKHVVHPTISGLGCTPDYMRIASGSMLAGAELGPVEIKVVSPFQADGWRIFDTDVGMECPPHIELQLQAQLMVLQKSEGWIAADVAGRLRILERELDPTAAQIIADAVGKFWATLARGDLPELQIDRDAGAIKRLYSKATEGRILLADDEVYRRALLLEEAREKAREAKEMSQSAEAELLLLIKDAEVIKLGDGRQLTAKMQKRAAYSVPATEFRILRFGKARA